MKMQQNERDTGSTLSVCVNLNGIADLMKIELVQLWINLGERIWGRSKKKWQNHWDSY